MSETRSRAVLSATLATTLVLVGLLWLVLRRPTSAESVESEKPSSAPQVPVADESRARVADASPMLTRVQVLPPAAPPVEPRAPAIVTGFLTLDDTPQDGGRATLRAADGSWERSVPLDTQGFFRLDGVPSTKLTLSFELPAQEERALFVAAIDVEPEPGAVADLELFWRSTQVNVKVVGDEREGHRAELLVEGPRLAGRVETSEKGRGSLTLVGTGRFTFTAVQRSGRRAQATLDLTGDEGLETVVIDLGEPSPR